MGNNSKNRELIENVVRQSPGYRANQDLFEEMVEESLKRLESFMENSDQASSEIYVKKIVSTVIIDAIKNSARLREEKNKKAEEINNFRETQIKYETDADGNIIYDVEVEPSQEESEAKIPEQKI